MKVRLEMDEWWWLSDHGDVKPGEVGYSHAADVPDELMKKWRRAERAFSQARQAVIDHLEETGQFEGERIS